MRRTACFGCSAFGALRTLGAGWALRTRRPRLLRLRLLCLLLRRLAFAARPGAAAPASAPAAARRRLLLARRHLCLLGFELLRTLRPRTARRTLRILGALWLLLRTLLLRPFAVAAALLLAIASLAALRTLVATRGLGAGPLLELADLLLHIPPRLLFMAAPELVMPAVRAALPPLGISLFAGGAKDGFRERHRRIGAHCTLRAVDETRRRTLLALIELASESTPSACWDDGRAIDLLRRQSTAEELRELGAKEGLIEIVFPESHAG